MAEKRTIELEIQDNSKSLKAQYREAVAELQKVSEQYGETSKEAVKAAKAAADLKDQIEFSKDLVDSFNPDAKFNALSRSVGGVLDGFQAFEGALGLIGVESEDLQKTMVRLQSVMALSQGLQGLMEAKDSFKQLGVVAANALKGIRAGVAATGIGLLLVAVGTLAAYWDDIKEALSGVSKEQDKLNKLTNANLKSAEAKVDSLNKQDNILRLQGKTEKQILQLKVAALDTAIKQAEVNLANAKATKKAQLEAEKRNYIILRGVLEFLSAPLALLLRSIDEIGKAFGKNFGLSDMIFGNLTELVFNPSEVEEEGDAAIKAAEDKLTELRNTQAGYKIEINRIEKEAQDERNRINSQGNRETTNNNNKEAKDQIDIQRRLEDEKLRIMEDGFDKEYAILKEKKKRDKEDAEKQFKDGLLKKEDYEKLLLQLDESFEADRKKLYDKSFNDNLKQKDFTINSLIEQKKTEAEIEMAAYLEKKEKQKQRDEEEKARIEQLNKDKFQLAKDGLQLVSDLASLFGQQDEKKAKLAFQVDKAAKISSATIAGYEAVLEAYKTGQKSPLTAVFPAYPYIQAGLAGAFAAVNIAKIGKAKFQSSGGGGGSMSPAGGGGGAAPMTANFNTIGSSGINQLAQLQQTPTQAYVVSGEVTSAQALDRNRVQNATL